MSDLCYELHQLCSLLPRLRFPFEEKDIPRNGVYILFEEGEEAHGIDRIVRIGSHIGQNKLLSRLREHFINENKDRSIFRKNIGRALLNRDQDPFLKYWELDLTARESREKYRALIDPAKQQDVERRVTEYIRSHFSFVVFQIDEQQRRLDSEKKLISTVSLCDECEPSANWLGLHSPKLEIRQSGLWQTNELYKQPFTANEFEKLRALILRKRG